MIEEKQDCFPSLDLLANVFHSYPHIDAVYLFGSAAQRCMKFKIDDKLTQELSSVLRNEGSNAVTVSRVREEQYYSNSRN